MLKKHPILKWILVSVLCLILLIVCFGFWFMSLIPPKTPGLEKTHVADLPYLSENVLPVRGKILAIVTSTDMIGNTEKTTGYELTELSRAYYVFKANGFDVDIASPKGGKPPVVIDDDDMGVFDFAFLNDPDAQYKVNNTIPVEDVIADHYQAVFFAGGKGAMFDFPENEAIQSIVRNHYQSNKVVGAVCHGPAALVNVTLDNGRSLLKEKEVSCFTNQEELLLISDAKTIFPFLLQDKMVSKGARFNEGAMYLENVSHDSNLITGQNPWSTWGTAEAMIKQMGYTPKYREITGEEHAVNVLSTYDAHGSQEAKDMIATLLTQEKKPVNRVLIASHSIVAAMKGDIGRFFDMIGLVSHAKKYDTI